MPERSVSTTNCHDFRSEIYASIFPRWVLMSIGSAFFMILMLLYRVTGANGLAASEAMTKGRLVETKFTEKVNNLEKGQVRIEGQLTAQGIILQEIKDSIPRGNNGN